MKKKRIYQQLIFRNGILSIFINLIIAIGKFILSRFFGIFFFISGIFNILILISKLFSIIGIITKDKKLNLNRLSGSFLTLSGILYAIYMLRLIYSDVKIINFDLFLVIIITIICIIEIIQAIIGCIRVRGIGHYYRNLKVIDLANALTAVVLTQIAIMNINHNAYLRVVNAILGLIVGLIIIIFSCFIIIAPKYSLVDRKRRVYLITNSQFNKEDKVLFKLTNSNIYQNYYFDGYIKDNKIIGHIIEEKSEISKLKIYYKIPIYLILYIFIIPYLIGALIRYFNNNKIINSLDELMKRVGCSIDIDEEID